MILTDKVVIVTGSGQGIGKAMVARMAGEGASVVVSGLDRGKIQNAVGEIQEKGGTAIGVKADVTSRSEVRNLVETAIKEFGPVDILVNNATLRRHSPSLLATTDEDWDIVLATGLKSVFNCIQAVACHMIDRKYGKIINISSSAGMGSSQAPNECNFNYGATKAAVDQLTKAFARQLGPHGINVNSIAPGSIETDQSFIKRRGEEAERHAASRARVAVLGRRGKPEEIANLALFLATDASSFITGQTILADGGRTDYML